MKNAEFIVKLIIEKLKDGMYEGNMHACLRDMARTTGGYVAQKEISSSDAMDIERNAISMCKDRRLGQNTWKKAFDYGLSQPITFSSSDYEADGNEEISMNAVIGPGMMKSSKKEKGKVIDRRWLQQEEVPPCKEDWDPRKDLYDFITANFYPDEYIGYNFKSWKPSEKSEKFLPRDSGVFARTAREFCQILQSKESIESAFEPYNEEAGAWIRVNPLDGTGVSDVNVTNYRHVLVESDELNIEEQYAILKELRLPISTLVHSGKKSLHALVKIDAGDDFDEYKKRVDFLYDHCKRNSFTIDDKNNNPSRLSRMPGITRNNEKQYIVAKNIGCSNWQEFVDHVESIDDDLPVITNLADNWGDKQEDLAPELIYGVLRRGHKLLISGPAKAGKSWSLMSLAIAMAEGIDWLGFPVEQGRCLYINLELDHRSCFKRFTTIYDKKKIADPNIKNIEIWNLRGKTKPMNELVPHLIRRAMKKRYDAIIIDPIYKVITGDENNASDMAKFCNQFDKLATALDCAVIYCHHHSKGTQGQKKSADRSSGSGVFARDPDAILDLLPLQISEEVSECILDDITKETFEEKLNQDHPTWRENIVGEETLTIKEFSGAIDRFLGESMTSTDLKRESVKKAESVTAWRIEGTLREFASFKPKNMFFIYPQHEADYAELLENALVEGEEPKKFKKTPKTEEQKLKEKIERELEAEEKREQKEIEKQKRLEEKEKQKIEKEKRLEEQKEQKLKEDAEEYISAFDHISKINNGKEVTVTAIAQLLDIPRSTANRNIKRMEGYLTLVKGGTVKRTEF